MSEADRVKYLRLALRALAVAFVFGVYPLTVLWPSGWSRSFVIAIALALSLVGPSLEG
jgi:hypothetical protein